MPAPLRIGVFGGTFNPIHVCHLRIAARVQALVTLDLVVFVPASVPPHKAKEDLAPAHHRLEMTRLAVAGWPGFEVDDLELKRPGPSYSADTMEEFRRRHPADELYFLMGIEMFIDLETWREPHRLLAASRVVVTARAGRRFAELTGLPWIGGTPREVLERFDAVPGESALDLGPTARVVLVKPEPCEISSTQIRLDLATGRSVKKVLPAPVHSYILKQKLYGARNATA
ncbi:MAG: nicotinate (nicotinamide) nucleotide adenylyltransferase [Nitrospirae bacterium]|nr:nicotinate (nicotinamide) nucleotide adenylyltransferase [Nitrospirota bacterium]